MLHEEITLSDPVHEVAELEEDEVDVGQVLAAQIGLTAEEGDEGANLVHQSLCDGRSVSLGVAWHSGGALKIRDDLCDHLDLSDLGGAVAKKLRPVLVRDKLHDRARVSQACLAIDKVGQVGESKTDSVLLLEPAGAIEIRCITLLVLILSEVDTQVDHLVSDLGGEAANGPVSKRGLLVRLSHFPTLMQNLFI